MERANKNDQKYSKKMDTRTKYSSEISRYFNNGGIQHTHETLPLLKTDNAKRNAIFDFHDLKNVVKSKTK